MNAKQIEWEYPQSSSAYGYIVTDRDVKIQLFSVDYNILVGDAKPWVLRSKLPGYSRSRYFDSKNKAKAAAQIILQRFAVIISEES